MTSYIPILCHGGEWANTRKVYQQHTQGSSVECWQVAQRKLALASNIQLIYVITNSLIPGQGQVSRELYDFSTSTE